MAFALRQGSHRARGYSMKKEKKSVFYRENCGGTVSNIVSGFRKTITCLADVDLYDDLKERIFRDDSSSDEPDSPEQAA